MDISPFAVYFKYHGVLHSVQIKPCCREDNVVDYAIWDDGKLVFTVTKQEDTKTWVIALKNADDDIDAELVQLIGAQIEKRMADKIIQ